MSVPSSPRSSAPGSARDRAPRKVSHFERQAHYHRLSKFPDRYTARLSAAPDDPTDLTPFATNFYKEHPEETDLSSPEEKLENLNSVLDGDLSSAERFTALSQKKAMIYLIHGDESPEMVAVLRDLGHFYSDSGRHESAARNLKAASNLANQVEIPREESLEIAIELAEEHLKNQEHRRQHISAAKSAISQFEDDTPSDADFKKRLCIVRARIAAGERNWKEADKQFSESLDAGAEDDPAVLVEAGDVCAELDEVERAKDLYKRAQEIHKRNSDDETVAAIARKIDMLCKQK